MNCAQTNLLQSTPGGIIYYWVTLRDTAAPLFLIWALCDRRCNKIVFVCFWPWRLRDVSKIAKIKQTACLCAGVFFSTVWCAKIGVKVTKQGGKWSQNGALGSQKWSKAPLWEPKVVQKWTKVEPKGMYGNTSKKILEKWFWRVSGFQFGGQNAPKMMPKTV